MHFWLTSRHSAVAAAGKVETDKIQPLYVFVVVVIVVVVMSLFTVVTNIIFSFVAKSCTSG